MARTQDNPLFLGYYANATAINAAFPVGQLGQFVNNAQTNTVWIWNGTVWADTTNPPINQNPGGSNTMVQFNNQGVFGGDSGLTYNTSTHVLTNSVEIITPHLHGATTSLIDAGTTIHVTAGTTLTLTSAGVWTATDGVNSIAMDPVGNTLTLTSTTVAAVGALTVSAGATVTGNVDATTYSVASVPGVDGTFLTGDTPSKTVTVSKGIITSIA